jgi:signal transduction histidine kinase
VLADLAPVRTGQEDVPLGPAWVEAIAPALALVSGLSLLWRHAYPRAVAGCVLGSYAGLAFVQGVVPPYAAWVVIWSLATSGKDRQRSITRAAEAAGATSVLLIAAELLRPGAGASFLLVVVTVLLTLTAVLVRSERARVEAVGRRAATEERLRIARDLHDLVGHGLSAIAVQSSTARVALDAGDADTASSALTAVERTSRVAMREMRQMLGVLSEVDDDGPPEPGTPANLPSPGLDDIITLVENVRAGGVAVALSRSGPWEAASPAVQLCAYRLVQEGLTNAVKHAPGAPVVVRLDATMSEGRVAVLTAGGGMAGAVSSAGVPGGGRGLAGLRTRVAALSGEFASGPTPDGWLVEARLPLREEAP